jgi:hypothetical protein
MSIHLTDEEWIEAFRKIGSPQLFAQAHNLNVRTVYQRRRSLEQRYSINLETTNNQRLNLKLRRIQEAAPNVRRGMNLEKGTVIVFSDAHFWPDETTTAFKSLIHFIKELKPVAIVCNGDAFDGASSSRHPRIGFSKVPTIKEEIEACKFYMGEIEKVACGAKLVWTMGNHDMRFESSLANLVGQFEGVEGFTLKDHFPFWQPCWSFWINEDTIIKHRFKGGRYGGYQNTVNGGVNIITGHTHVLAVSPVTDYNGTRYGVQTGCLADPHSESFNYAEDSPKDWRSGFAVLTWDRNKLLLPELVQVWDEDEVQFRGQIVKV